MVGLLRAFNPSLYDLIQPYRVTDDKLMPWAYQFANPQGRPYHNDWGVMSSNPIMKAIQPFQKIKRMDCAYRIPLPAKITHGAKCQEWQPWEDGYPLAPGAQVKDRPIWDGTRSVMAPHILLDVSLDGCTTYAGFIAGEWRDCFTRYQKKIFGRMFKYYNGLKPDVGVTFDESLKLKSDCMWWFPEVAATWITA